MSYKSMVTSDPMGTLKTVLGSSLGMIPEIGPLLSLGVSLFFPESGDKGLSILTTHLEEEMKERINEAVDQQNKELTNIALTSSKGTWKFFVTSEYNNCIANVVAVDPSMHFDNIPEDQLGTLYANMESTIDSCTTSGWSVFQIVPRKHSYISTFINFASFHLSISSSFVKLKSYLKRKYPKKYKALTSNSKAEDFTIDSLYALQVQYSNYLREAVSELNPAPRYQSFNGEFQPINKVVAQTVIDPLLTSGTISYSDTPYPHYLRMRQNFFYTYIAKVILPVLWHWENGLPDQAGLKKIKHQPPLQIKTDTGINPGIPYPVVPAGCISAFEPFLFAFTWDLFDTYNFDLSNPSDRDDITNVNDAITSSTAFEKSSWMRWGKSSDSIRDFNIVIDSVSDFNNPSGTDYPLFKNLTPGAITNVVHAHGTDIHGHKYRGHYPQAVIKSTGTVPLDIYLGTVGESLASEFNIPHLLGEAYLNSVLTTPLVGTPKADDFVGMGVFGDATPYGPRSITFSGISTINEWGAKIFAKPPDGVTRMDCQGSARWNFAPGAAHTVDVPIDGRYLQYNPEMKFPKAVPFAVVVYQIDTAAKLIKYYPGVSLGGEKSLEVLDPNLPVYVAINDTIYSDNSGTFSIKAYANGNSILILKS